AAIGPQRLLEEANQGSRAEAEQVRAAVQRETQRPPSGGRDELRAFKTLKANLEVYGNEKAPVLRIRYTAEDPVLAADVVNSAAKLLVGERRAALEQRLANTINALHEQIDKIHTQI